MLMQYRMTIVRPTVTSHLYYILKLSF